MFIAELAGLEIFATGGIGGVHRGAEETFDISADLVELSRTRLAVVCAGAKSILDIAKTLEYLESQGVAVCGYRCDEFPAFYARTSGVKLDHRFDGPHDLARMIRLQREIGPGGVLIANPIPEAHALDAEAIEQRIGEAVAGSAREGDREEGGYAVPARPHRRADGRTQPRSQHGAGAQQRRRRLKSRWNCQNSDVGRQTRSCHRRCHDGRHRGSVGADRRRLRSQGPNSRGSRRLRGDAGCLAGPLRPERRFCRARRRCGFRARKRRFRAAGVTPHLAADPELETGRLIALVDPTGERSFLTDRGANDALSPQDIPLGVVEAADHIHISGYALISPGPRGAVMAAMKRAVGTPVSVDPGSAEFLREIGPDVFLDWVSGAEMLFPNAEEAAVLACSDDEARQRERLGARFDWVIVKRGRAGAVMWSGAEFWSVSAPQVAVVDTTGAGDAFVAAFLAARLQGEDEQTCLVRAVAAGSAATQYLGGRPRD